MRAPAGGLQFLAQSLDLFTQPIVFFTQPIVLALDLLQTLPQFTEFGLPLLQLLAKVAAVAAFYCSLSWHGIFKMSSPCR